MNHPHPAQSGDDDVPGQIGLFGDGPLPAMSGITPVSSKALQRRLRARPFKTRRRAAPALSETAGGPSGDAVRERALELLSASLPFLPECPVRSEVAAFVGEHCP